jgi:SAM-dependent methyltransferase
MVKHRNLHTKEIFETAYGNRDWNWYRSLVANSIRYGMPGKWLDLGAGLGFFVECAQRFGIDCNGLEGSAYAVNEAKKRYTAINIKQHLLENGLPFENNSISTIVCHQTIEHISPEAAQVMLKESYRVLIKDGVILIYSPCIYNRKQRMEETHINLYKPKQLASELKKAGFLNIKRMDNPRTFFGKCRIERVIMNGIFKIFPFDFLSDSANCIAVKHS